MRSRRRQWLARIVQAVIVLVIVAAIFRAAGLQIADLAATDLIRWRPAPGPLLASTAILLGVYLTHAYLWRRVMVDLDVGRPTARATIRIYFLASLGRYVPGKIWQVAGLALLAGRAGLPPVGATASALLGQFAFLATGAVFLVLVLPGWGGAGPITAALASVGLVSAAFLMARTQPGARIRTWLAGRLPAAAPVLDIAGRIRLGSSLTWGLGYAASWLLLGTAFAVFVGSFVPEALNAPRHLAGTVAAAYLAGYIAFVAPAGVGVRESVMAVLLAQTMPASAAVVASIASRLWFTAAELIPLAAYPLLREPTTARTDNPGTLRSP